MIAVSFLKSKYSRVDTIHKIDESNADLIHVDLLDGIYAGVNNIDIDELLTELNNTYLDLIHYVLIMSVFPGKGGQEFIQEVLNKIPYLYDKNVLIGIDGGINDESIKYLNNYQIDNIVRGSFICMRDDFNKQIRSLK